jgi:hypothetical protein
MRRFTAIIWATVVAFSGVAYAQQATTTRPPYRLNQLTKQNAHTFVCNPTSGQASLQACLFASYFNWSGVTLGISPFGGDSGSGGSPGLVPAPLSGDTAAGKVLGAGGGWIPLTDIGNGTVNAGLNTQFAGYTADGRTVSGLPNFTFTNGDLTFGSPGSVTGRVKLSGSASGMVNIQPQPVAGSYNFNLPATAGSPGQPMLSGGGGATPMAFGNLTVGAGGTGATTLANNTLLKGAGSSPIAGSSIVDDGTVVTTPEPISTQASPILTEIANDTTTGTVVNKLAKLSGAPSKAIIITTSDVSGIEGVVYGNAGTTGNARIATSGQVSCVFDGATVAGDYVQASVTAAGSCHDAGATLPTNDAQILGRVLSTNGAGGTFAIRVALHNRGQGTAADANTGTSGHTLPYLDGTNTFSGTNSFGTGLKITNSSGVTQCVHVDSTGAVSATAAGDCGAGAGGGNVTGPASSTDNFVPQWNLGTGTSLKAGLPVATTSTANALTETGAGGKLDPTFLPNPSATTLGGIQSFAAVTNQWIKSISTSGVPSSTQPNFSDLAGTVDLGGAQATGTAGVVRGGTGNASIAQHQMYLATGANVLAPKTLPDCPDTGGNHMNFTQATDAWSCGTSGTGGGGGVNPGTLGQFSGYTATGSAVSGLPNFTFSAGGLTAGVSGSILGTLSLSGNTSGVVTIQPQAAAGNYNFNLPTSPGASGQPLLSGGGGGTPMTFGTLSVGGGGIGKATITSNVLQKGAGTGPMADSSITDDGTNVTITEPVDTPTVTSQVVNAGTTGTTVNKLAKLTGAPSTAVIITTADTSGIEGVVYAGAGTTGSAKIAREGQVSCVFDSGTVAGDYVQASPTAAGSCRDVGAAFPSNGAQVLGRVLSTNAAAGTFAMRVLPSGLGVGPGLAARNAWTGQNGTPPVPLTDAATIAVNANLGNSRTVTLGGNRLLGNPTNLVVGDWLTFWFTQDATGGRTITLDTQYHYPDLDGNGSIDTPTLPTPAGSVGSLTCYALTSTDLRCSGITSYPSVASTTWDPAHFGSSCSALSSGNKVVTGNAGGGDCRVYATNPQTSGIFYFEVDFTSSSSDPGVGVGTTTAATGGGSYLGQDTGSEAYYAANVAANLGTIIFNNANVAGGAALDNAVVPFQVCTVVDITHNKIWVQPFGTSQWNNGAIGAQSPAANLGGATLSVTGPLVAAVNVSGNDVATLVTGAGACSGITGLAGSPLP